jgi:hypothetical protein
VIQCFLDLGGHRLDLLLKLLSGACGGPIYHPREFHGIQSPYSASLRRRLHCLSSIIQEEASIALIYHWEEFGSIWGLHLQEGRTLGIYCL